MKVSSFNINVYVVFGDNQMWFTHDNWSMEHYDNDM